MLCKKQNNIMYHLSKGRKRIHFGEIFDLHSFTAIKFCRNLRTFFRQILIASFEELTKNCLFQVCSAELSMYLHMYILLYIKWWAFIATVVKKMTDLCCNAQKKF